MKSYLVIGMGHFGSSIAQELYNLKNDVLALDEHEKDISHVVDNVTDAVIGDAKDEAVLKSLGIHNFDCVIVAIAKQEDSILINMLVKEMGARYIISKASNELHARILNIIGVDRVVRPEYEMGLHIARSL